MKDERAIVVAASLGSDPSKGTSVKVEAQNPTSVTIWIPDMDRERDVGVCS